MKIKGFLVIIVLTAGIVYFLWMMKGGKEQMVEEVKAYSEVKLELTKANMSTLRQAIISFIAQEGRTPESLKELKGFHGPLGANLDAWGTSIKYERLSDEDFRLISAGKDKVFNTPDDIVIDY